MLVDAIRQDAEERARERIEDAKREAKAVLARARDEAERRRSERIRLAQGQALREKKRMIAAAKLDLQRQAQADREALIDGVFEAARDRLEAISREGSYPAILARLIREAIGALPGKAARVLVRQEDLPILTEAFLKEAVGEEAASGEGALRLRAEASPRPISGGCIVESEDGHCAFDNSFERRLERALPSLRPAVSGALFGEKRDAG